MTPFLKIKSFFLSGISSSNRFIGESFDISVACGMMTPQSGIDFTRFAKKEG